MTKRTGSPWLNYLLGLLCVGAIVAAILLVGPASGSTTAVTRTAKVAEGVVQSTVSGSGNLQPASQLNLGFRTSGNVTKIYVTQGEYVTEGKLIAELNPQSAEVTLEQSKATLLSAEANLAKEEETDGEGTTGSSGSASGSASAAAASVHPIDTEKEPESATGTAPSATSTESTHTTTTPSTTSTEPTHTTTSESTGPQGKREEAQSNRSSSNGGNSGQSSGSSSKENESSDSSSKATISTATREANLASARAAVKSDQLTVQSDEEAVGATKLYAPQSGTIVSLSGQVGEVVSGNGTTKASSSGSSSSSGSGSSAAGSSAATGRSTGGASSSSSSGSDSSTSSSSAFAVLSDLSSMQLVVALSESEIGNVKVGQIATVTVEALEGRTQGGTSSGAHPEGPGQASKLAAHVSEVATLSTSSSGVVSYDVTFQLDQMTPGLKPGMSATAEVVVKQAEGVNVPTTAISADSVTVLRGGKDVRQRVVTGLAGNTSTIILSGLKAGETVLLPAATSTSSSTSLTSRLSRLAGGSGGLGGGAVGGGGGGFGGAGGGGGAFFRGGG
jgi:multidrug resistance efflux pump